MDAGKVLISQIFSKRLLEIPFYQRAYVWKEEQWDRLISDMEFVTETRKPYFLGSVILKQGEAPKTWENFSDRKIVVDGQQRLTTLLILLKVIALKTGKTKSFDNSFRLEDDDEEKQGPIALAHGKNDFKDFNLVMDYTVPEKIAITEKSQIISAFNYFIDKVDIDKIDKNAITQNVQFVCIELSEGEDEQQVFDTINSLGVSLTTAELLKNYFFNKDNIEEYKKYWYDTFESTAEKREYWEMEMDVGKKKRAMIDIFFDSYFQLFLQNKKYKVTAEDKIYYSRDDRLAQSYQDFIKKYCNNDKHEILGTMAEYANLFQETFKPSYCKKSMIYSSVIQRINVIIFGLKNSTLIPYLLFISKNVTDETERNRIMSILEAYIMRRMVLHITTKNYNRLFTSLILNETITAEALTSYLKESDDTTMYIPSDEELLKGFNESKLSNLQTKGIVYFIESYKRNSKDSTSLLGFDSYSLEHLMPKKWRNEWDIPDNEEKIKQRDSILLTLGNLAIITQTLNASIRDSKWEDKKTGKNKEDSGLNACAAGLYTMSNVLSQNVWNEEQIKIRAGWLYNQAKEMWKI